ncbi:MAG: hypothetical protein LIQ31_07845, partial [Planctomycetes bacterium]|nr:hypothetical protein [Planctomycetota bacterium]
FIGVNTTGLAQGIRDYHEIVNNNVVLNLVSGSMQVNWAGTSANSLWSSDTNNKNWSRGTNTLAFLNGDTAVFGSTGEKKCPRPR